MAVDLAICGQAILLGRVPAVLECCVAAKISSNKLNIIRSRIVRLSDSPEINQRYTMEIPGPPSGEINVMVQDENFEMWRNASAWRRP
jgi:hypothetical protein